MRNDRIKNTSTIYKIRLSIYLPIGSSTSLKKLFFYILHSNYNGKKPSELHEKTQSSVTINVIYKTTVGTAFFNAAPTLVN